MLLIKTWFKSRHASNQVMLLLKTFFYARHVSNQGIFTVNWNTFYIEPWRILRAWEDSLDSTSNDSSRSIIVNWNDQDFAVCFKSAIKSSGSVVVSHLNNNQIRKPGGKEIDSAMDHNAPDLVLRLPNLVQFPIFWQPSSDFFTERKNNSIRIIS